MLVLSRKPRKPNEPDRSKIVTDGPVIIEVLEVRGKNVRLGLRGAASTGMWRGEIALQACENVGGLEAIGLQEYEVLLEEGGNSGPD